MYGKTKSQKFHEERIMSGVGEVDGQIRSILLWQLVTRHWSKVGKPMLDKETGNSFRLKNISHPVGMEVKQY